MRGISPLSHSLLLSMVICSGLLLFGTLFDARFDRFIGQQYYAGQRRDLVLPSERLWDLGLITAYLSSLAACTALVRSGRMHPLLVFASVLVGLASFVALEPVLHMYSLVFHTVSDLVFVLGSIVTTCMFLAVHRRFAR